MVVRVETYVCPNCQRVYTEDELLEACRYDEDEMIFHLTNETCPECTDLDRDLFFEVFD